MAFSDEIPFLPPLFAVHLSMLGYSLELTVPFGFIENGIAFLSPFPGLNFCLPCIVYFLKLFHWIDFQEKKGRNVILCHLKHNAWGMLRTSGSQCLEERWCVSFLLLHST